MTAKEAFLRWRLKGRGRRVEGKDVIVLYALGEKKEIFQITPMLNDIQ